MGVSPHRWSPGVEPEFTPRLTGRESCVGSLILADVADEVDRAHLRVDGVAERCVWAGGRVGRHQSQLPVVAEVLAHELSGEVGFAHVNPFPRRRLAGWVRWAVLPRSLLASVPSTASHP